MTCEYLLVDGYNIIFAWPELKELAAVNLDGARTKLQDILCNYQGYKKCQVILVFDGYKVKGNPGEVIQYHNIHVIFTKEAETADQYIEKVTQQIGRRYQVAVATSDKLEQVIILGKGALRLSARDLFKEIKETNDEINVRHLKQIPSKKNRLFDNVDPQLLAYLEDIRLDRLKEKPAEKGGAKGKKKKKKR
ncbi:MAG: NYN domain-containing protein [Enterocloster asparagiformis]|nr:NYN domain-containing protein [Enterocloster asparagiformis]